jgi:hypothetical protein
MENRVRDKDFEDFGHQLRRVVIACAGLIETVDQSDQDLVIPIQTRDSDAHCL